MRLRVGRGRQSCPCRMTGEDLHVYSHPGHPTRGCIPRQAEHLIATPESIYTIHLSLTRKGGSHPGNTRTVFWHAKSNLLPTRQSYLHVGERCILYRFRSQHSTQDHKDTMAGVHFSSSSLLLSSLELSDTKVYEPWIRARLGTVLIQCRAGQGMLSSRNTYNL